MTIAEEPVNTTVMERDRVIRRKVMAKVTTENPLKVEIKAVGAGRFRINVWAETGDKSEGSFFNEKRIVESFYHID